jgi:very-short-patch-repair endonuclease
MLWAMATLSASINKPAIAALATQAMTLAKTFNKQNLANTLWAMAKLGYRDEKALTALMVQICEKHSSFDAQEISNILYAMAQLNYRDEASLTALLERAWSLTPCFNIQNITNTLWSLACLGEVERLQDFIKGIAFRVDLAASDFQKENMIQMHYVRLYCQLILKIPLPCFFDGIVVSRDMLGITTSRLQLEIATVIRELGAHHGYSVLDEAILNGISVDMLIKPHNIVVEVDGPFHFIRSADHKLSYHGPSQLKDLLLNAMGYRVLHITQAAWFSHSTTKAKKAYLSSTLSKKLSSTPESSIPFLHLKELRARKAESSMPSTAAPL